MVYTIRARKAIKGCLEVKAVRDTQRGVSGEWVSKGTIGYVVAVEGIFGVKGPTGNYIICWPSLNSKYSSHHKSDVVATGKRG